MIFNNRYVSRYHKPRSRTCPICGRYRRTDRDTGRPECHTPEEEGVCSLCRELLDQCTCSPATEEDRNDNQ